MNTLDYIIQRFNVDLNVKRMPVEIPNFGRNELAKLFDELGFRIGAEIGIQQGQYSEVLCQANPGLKLYCIDPWKAYKGYREYVTQDRLDAFLIEALERLGGYDCEIIQRFSMDAVKTFADNSLDFVYLDGNHDFKNVACDITEWSRKIRPGGIISGHDYIRRKPPTTTHVTWAVQGYTAAYNISPWFLLGTRARTSGHIRDKSRSFMWVKG